MGAEDPGGLEVEDVFVGDVAALVLVHDAEAEELGPVPAHVRRDGPGVPGVVVGVLGVVEAKPGVPVAVELLLGQRVRAPRGVLAGGVEAADVTVDQLGLEELVVEAAGASWRRRWKWWWRSGWCG